MRPNINPSAPRTTAPQSTKLTTLDDRINAAFLADDIAISPSHSPPPLPTLSNPPSKKSRLSPIPTPNPNPKTDPPHSPSTQSPPSAATRLAARKAAFEAARSGEWAGRIRLASIRPVIGHGLIGSEVTTAQNGAVVNGDEDEDEDEEEEDEEEEEAGLVEAGRWGE